MKPSVWVMKRALRKRRGKATHTYSVQWRDPTTGRTRTETIGADKMLAQIKAEERRRELAAGTYVGIKPITFADFKEEHVRLMEGQRAPATVTETATALRQFDGACHPKNMTVIDYAMIERFRNARQATGISPATVNKSLRTLRAALQAAVERGYLLRNPFAGRWGKLKVMESEPVPTVLSAEHFEKLLGACEEDRWRAFCMLGYYAGLRMGEITSLQWEDVDMGNDVLHVRNKIDHRTKSGKNRTVPIAAPLLAVLTRLRLGRLASDYVIRNANGDPMTNNARACFQRRVVAAGLVDDDGKALYTPHDLRRSAGTNWANVVKSPKIVQELMGHAKLETTMKFYVSAGMDEKRRAIEGAVVKVVGA